MQYVQQILRLSDGRDLEVATVGDPGGRTVFYHHGTPGSSTLIPYFASVATRHGLFVVSLSRPGYGYSTRLAGRQIASVVPDVRVVLDALGRDEYVAVGWSGGGPHALACASLDAPRCRAAWSLAGVVPMDVDFDWTAGMGQENIDEFAVAKEGGDAYEAQMESAAEQFGTADADNIVELFGGLLSDVDQAALGDQQVRVLLADATRHAFARGWHGFFDDDRSFFAPWGFEPSRINVPVSVWYGDADLMVPASHGAWLADNVPTATVTHYPDDGHISLVVDHLDELAGEIARVFD